jgi:hypothetical protein
MLPLSVVLGAGREVLLLDIKLVGLSIAGPPAQLPISEICGFVFIVLLSLKSPSSHLRVLILQ